MDNVSLHFFNNGVNNGDVTFVSKDGIKINCHSGVLNKATDYLIGLTSWQEIKLDHNSEEICSALSLIYGARVYDLPLCSLKTMNNESVQKNNARTLRIMNIILVLDTLKATRYEVMKLGLEHLFERSVWQQNWVHVFKQIINDPRFNDLVKILIRKAEVFIYSTNRSEIPNDILRLLLRHFTFEPFFNGKDDHCLVNYTRREFISVLTNDNGARCQSIWNFMKKKFWSEEDNMEIEPFFDMDKSISQIKEELIADNYTDVSHHLQAYRLQCEYHKKH